MTIEETDTIKRQKLAEAEAERLRIKRYAEQEGDMLKTKILEDAMAEKRRILQLADEES